MKKLLFIGLAASLLIAGCAKNEVDRISGEDRQIIFQAVTGTASTKDLSATAGNTYPETVPFGTAAFFSKDTWATPATGAADAGKFIEKSKVGFINAGQYWTTVDPDNSDAEIAYYWPLSGYLTFFSFSPWETLNTAVEIDNTDGVKITDWDVDANQTADVMVADIANDLTDNNMEISPWKKGVNTVFRHKLAQVVGFEIKTKVDYLPTSTPAVGDMRVFINKITIKSVNYKGSYTSGIDATSPLAGTWAVTNDHASKKTYEVFIDEYVSEADPGTEIFEDVTDAHGKFPVTNSGNSYLLVLPQTFVDGTIDYDGRTDSYSRNTEAEIELTYTVRQHYQADVTKFIDTQMVQTADLYDVHSTLDHAWEMNKLYKYSLTLDLKDSRIYWAPSIAEWDAPVFGEVIL